MKGSHPRAARPIARAIPLPLKNAALLFGASLSALFVIAALVGPELSGADPYAVSLNDAFAPPRAGSWLGKDELGRDLWARTLYGARLAFLTCIPGVGAGAALGVALGLWAGLKGGWLERLAMRAVDALLAFPGFLLALVAAAALGPGTGNLVIAIGFFSFGPFARMARALAVSLKREEFVAAATALGAGHGHILRRHILPNALGPLLALAAVRTAAALTTASGLSFLGLGPPLPAADWGVMLDTGREYMWHAPRLVVVPGLALFLSAVGFYLLGEGLTLSRTPVRGPR